MTPLARPRAGWENAALMRASWRWKGAVDGALVAGFLLALLAPAIDVLARPVDVRSVEYFENRASRPWPEAPTSLATLNAWPDAFDAWQGDRFGLRDRLMRWRSIVRLEAFGVSPHPAADVGKDGWWFLSTEPFRSDHRGVLRLDPAELANTARNVESWRTTLEQRGVQLVLVIAPDKDSIYLDKLPDSWRSHGPTRCDQWLAYMRENTKLRILDLRPALRAAVEHDRPGDELYFRLGSHWYGRGAYIAYVETVKELARGLPGMEPLPLDSLVVREGPDDSWAQLAYVPDLFPHKAPCYYPREPKAKNLGSGAWQSLHTTRTVHQDPNLPRLCFLHDSMAAYYEDLLAEHFSAMTCHWLPLPDPTVIGADRPNVVVIETIERELPHLWFPYIDGVNVFQSLEKSWADGATLFALDVERDLARIEPQRTAALARGASGGIELEMRSGGDTFVLPPIELPPDRSSIVRMEVESPDYSTLELFWREKGDAEFRRKKSRRVGLDPGKNVCLVPLDGSDRIERLMLRPGSAPGTYLLRSLELRHPGADDGTNGR